MTKKEVYPLWIWGVIGKGFIIPGLAKICQESFPFLGKISNSHFGLGARCGMRLCRKEISRSPVEGLYLPSCSTMRTTCNPRTPRRCVPTPVSLLQCVPTLLREDIFADYQEVLLSGSGCYLAGSNSSLVAASLPMDLNIPGAVRVARHAMATRFEAILCGGNEASLRAAAEEALDEIERIDRQLSIYRVESDLSAVNRYAETEPFVVEPRLFRLLERIQDLYRTTGGAFDPSIAPVLHVWGFMGRSPRVPASEELSEARSRVGLDALDLDSTKMSVSFLRPGMWLDLGSVGKGYALEKAVEVLRDCGVESGLIHGGTSTICAIGRHPSGKPWLIEILRENPMVMATFPRSEIEGHIDLSIDTNSQIKCVALEDKALSMSAPKGKSFVESGVEYGHVLDPRTGVPVKGSRSAICVGPSATDTDALSTALLVLGQAGIPALKQAHPDYEFR